MAWTYEQSTGNLTDPNGTLLGQGYSGNGVDLDQPTDQNVPCHGPIPQGQWAIGTFFDDPGGKGPIVCHLTPAPETVTFGRSGFMIHGDNAAANHTASEGCIILARPFREAIAASGDTVLTVTP
jgi:uncharacterized Zn-binding protein involved in type VI secretion